jgi:hypothetical protein
MGVSHDRYPIEVTCLGVGSIPAAKANVGFTFRIQHSYTSRSCLSNKRCNLLVKGGSQDFSLNVFRLNRWIHHISSQYCN